MAATQAWPACRDTTNASSSRAVKPNGRPKSRERTRHRVVVKPRTKNNHPSSRSAEGSPSQRGSALKQTRLTKLGHAGSITVCHGRSKSECEKNKALNDLAPWKLLCSHRSTTTTANFHPSSAPYTNMSSIGVCDVRHRCARRSFGRRLRYFPTRGRRFPL